MNQTLENKLSMYLAVQKVCADNNSIWSGIVACVATMNDLQNKVNEIVAVRQVQETNPTGITLDKHVKRAAMIDYAMFVKGAVQAYATDINNYALFESVKYSVSDMKRAADTLCRDRAWLIYNKASDVAGGLASYGVDAAVLSTLQTLIAEYADMIAGPRTARNAIKAATTALKQLFADTDIVVKRKIDLLMLQFKRSHATFYNTYKNARQIIDLGKGSKTVEVLLNGAEMRTVHRVIHNSVLVNTGPTALRYSADRLVVDEDAAAVLVLPGASVKITSKESFVTIRNSDEHLKGSFKVKVTSEVPVRVGSG